MHAVWPRACVLAESTANSCNNTKSQYAHAAASDDSDGWLMAVMSRLYERPLGSTVRGAWITTARAQNEDSARTVARHGQFAQVKQRPLEASATCISARRCLVSTWDGQVHVVRVDQPDREPCVPRKGAMHSPLPQHLHRCWAYISAPATVQQTHHILLQQHSHCQGLLNIGNKLRCSTSTHRSTSTKRAAGGADCVN